MENILLIILSYVYHKNILNKDLGSKFPDSH